MNDVELIKQLCAREEPLSNISARRIGDLREAIRWIAQTNHQGNHTDQDGTFETCPKNTCSHATEHLRIR